MPTQGHNAGDDTFEVTDEQLDAGNVSAEELRQLIEAIESMEEDKKGIADDIKDKYAEAKSRGFDTKTMRRIVALRKMDKDTRDEADAILETYRNALGM